MADYDTNPQVQKVITPPIAEVQGWIEGRKFSEERPLFDISQAVPSYGPAAPLLDYLASQLHDSTTALYTDILGLPVLRTALAEHLSQDYQGVVHPEQIAITAGCNQAFCVAIDVIAQQGDEVILILPYYFNHYMWLQMRNIHARCVPFRQNNPPQVEDIVSRIGPSTRAIVLVTPNNPTGIEYSPEFITEVYDVAQTHSLALLIDETYKDFRADTDPPHTLLNLPDWEGNLIQLISFSKSYALTGYRIGAIVASAQLNHEIEKVLDNLVICPSHIGQLAALYSLQHLGEWKQNKANMLRDRVTQLRQCFENDTLHYNLVSSGAYFAYVQHPFRGLSAYAVARRLANEFNILCLPGPMFGPGQEAYMRFAFANLGVEHIPNLVERLKKSQSV